MQFFWNPEKPFSNSKTISQIKFSYRIEKLVKSQQEWPGGKTLCRSLVTCKGFFCSVFLLLLLCENDFCLHWVSVVRGLDSKTYIYTVVKISKAWQNQMSCFFLHLTFDQLKCSNLRPVGKLLFCKKIHYIHTTTYLTTHLVLQCILRLLEFNSLIDER